MDILTIIFRAVWRFALVLLVWLSSSHIFIHDLDLNFDMWRKLQGIVFIALTAIFLEAFFDVKIIYEK